MPGFSTIAVTGNKNISDKKFEVSELKIRPLIPTEGKQVTISAKVSNLTSTDQVYPANVWIDNTVEESKVLSIAANGSDTVTFNLNKPVGKYDVRIEQLLGSFSVGSAPTPTKVPAVIAVKETPVKKEEIAAPATAVPPTATPRPSAPATAVPPTATPKPAPVTAPTAIAPTATPKTAPTAAPPTAVPATATPKPPAPATAVPVITAPEPTATPANTPTPVPPSPVTEDDGSNMGLIIAIVVIAILAVGGGLGFMVFRNKS